MEIIKLNEEQWEAFNKALETELPENSKLEKLAQRPSPFDS